MLDEDKTYIKLCCNKCDNINCKFAEILGYTTADSKRGCSREVNELIASKFFYYTQEVIPFWKMSPTELVNEQYFEIINFLNEEIYNKPITNLYNHKGKVLLSRKEIIKEYYKIVSERF